MAASENIYVSCENQPFIGLPDITIVNRYSISFSIRSFTQDSTSQDFYLFSSGLTAENNDGYTIKLNITYSVGNYKTTIYTITNGDSAEVGAISSSTSPFSKMHTLEYTGSSFIYDNSTVSSIGNFPGTLVIFSSSYIFLNGTVLYTLMGGAYTTSEYTSKYLNIHEIAIYSVLDSENPNYDFLPVSNGAARLVSGTTQAVILNDSSLVYYDTSSSGGGSGSGGSEDDSGGTGDDSDDDSGSTITVTDNKLTLVINNGASTQVTFDSSSIRSCSSTEEISLVGAELPYSTLTFSVFYEGSSVEVFAPSDYVDGIMTSDNYIFSGHYATDIRTYPYGTSVLRYIDDQLLDKYYVESVERTNRNQYTFNCISDIGILNKQYFVGNVYRDVTVSSVIDAIMADTGFTYSINSTFGAVKLFGWIPYCTKREALQQILFAVNGQILRGANYSIVFGFVNTNTVKTIPYVNVYNSGTEKYPALATKVTVTEHTYFYSSLVEPVELFNNTKSISSASNLLVQFDDAPVYVPSITASGSLTIIESGANYAIVSGVGVLTGVPYVHTTYDVVRTQNTGGDEYEVTVTDATLVSIANSENVADRVMNYYSAQETSDVSFVEDVELANLQVTCGKRYLITNAFNERRIGYIYKMTKTRSSFTKMDCEVVYGYDPAIFGNNYQHYSLRTGSTTWTVPDGVTKLRVLLIGGGSGGSSGARGETGSANVSGRGGRGGDGGTHGAGGKCKIISLTVTPGNTVSISCGTGGSGGVVSKTYNTRNSGSSGTATSITYNSTTYSTSDADAASTDYGVANLFTNTVYASPGIDGIAGVAGGDGGSDDTGSTQKRTGDSGESLTYKGTTYTGGSGGAGGTTYQFKAYSHAYAVGGGGGGGAAVGHNGTNGSVGTADTSDAVYIYDSFYGDYISIIETHPIYSGQGGDGGVGNDGSSGTNYGDGGSGGFGGGGGGSGSTSSEWSALNYKTLLKQWDDGDYHYSYDTTAQYGYSTQIGDINNGIGGDGGAGGKGIDGAVIIFYA